MKLLFRILSVVLYPLFMPTYAILLLFWFQYGQVMETESVSAPLIWNYFTILTAVIFFFTAFLPILNILGLRFFGVITDITLMNPKERIVPYILTLISFGVGIFYLRDTEPLIVAFLTAALVALIIVFIVNFWWKISAHLCGMGCFCAATWVTALYLLKNFSALLIILFILSGLLATARIYLKSHTLMQTLAGFAVGFLSVAISGCFL